MRRRLVEAAICLALAILFGPISCVFAANTPGTVWDGGDTDNNWASGDNWNGGGGSPQIPTNLSPIIMAGSVRLSNNVNATSMTNLFWLKFSNDVAASFVIGGNGLILNQGGLINIRSGQQTISNRLDLAAAQTWTNSGGPLVFFGTVTNRGNQLILTGVGSYRFNGALDGSGPIWFNGAGTNFIGLASGFTGDLTNDGGGIVIVGANTALGGTAGRTIIRNNSTLAFSNDITYTTAENVEVNGNGVNGMGGINNIDGTNTFQGPVTLVANSRIGSEREKLILSGAVTNGGFTLSITNLANSAIMFSNIISGSGGLIKEGAGDTFLNSSNTFTGNVTVNGSGRLVMGATNALPGNVTVNSGGTLALERGIDFTNSAPTVTLNGLGQSGVGALDNLSGTNIFREAVTLGSAASIGTEADRLTMNGNINNNTFSLEFTNVANSEAIISGVISGSGGLTHRGTGSLVLNAANTFTGPVTNFAGTISVTNASSLGTSSSYIVAGGTLLFNGFTNTSAAVTLSGGTIQEVDKNVSLGALTISANSIISLGSGGAQGSLRFASGTNTVGAGATLTIYGWSWNSGLTGGSDDLIFFTSTTFETASFLNNVTFFGTGGGARVLSSGELVPITPEPTTMVTGCLTLLMVIRQYFRKKETQ